MVHLSKLIDYKITYARRTIDRQREKGETYFPREFFLVSPFLMFSFRSGETVFRPNVCFCNISERLPFPFRHLWCELHLPFETRAETKKQKQKNERK